VSLKRSAKEVKKIADILIRQLINEKKYILNENRFFYFLFFKTIFKIKKQTSITAKPARKLRVESIE
jgi:hypothetical protein